MEFFTLYSWMEGRAASPRGNGEGLSRFIEHYAVGMIGRGRYWLKWLLVSFINADSVQLG